MWWLISLSIISSGFIHVVSGVRISNLIKVESYCVVWIMLYFVYPSHLLMGTWVASPSWPMWTVLLWTREHRSLRFCFSFFGVPTQKQNCCLIFWGTAILFSITVAPFYILTRLTTSPHPCQNILSCFYVIVILIGEKWYLIVVLISIFLVIP